jgi:two-component system nitrate/nitrite response regulator NarL
MTAQAGLTQHELRIVQLMAAGQSTAAIAGIVGLRPYTVENQKRHIYAKLGVSSQSHAVARAILLGVLDTRRRILQTRENPSPTMILVHGATDDCRDQVILVLATHQLPVLDLSAWQLGGQRKSLCLILIDPQAADWEVPFQLGLPTIVVRCSASGDEAAATDDLARGARALIFADDVASDLIPMLALTAKGHLVVSGVYTGVLTRWACGHSQDRPELTAREWDILSSIASGHTIRRTGQTLGISAKTVENTQARLFRKLGARNRVEVLSLANRWGLLDRLSTEVEQPCIAVAGSDPQPSG